MLRSNVELSKWRAYAALDAAEKAGESLDEVEAAEADGVPAGETGDLRAKHDAAQAKAATILRSL